MPNINSRKFKQLFCLFIQFNLYRENIKKTQPDDNIRENHATQKTYKVLAFTTIYNVYRIRYEAIIWGLKQQCELNWINHTILQIFAIICLPWFIFTFVFKQVNLHVHKKRKKELESTGSEEINERELQICTFLMRKLNINASCVRYPINLSTLENDVAWCR